MEGQNTDPKTWKANFRCAMNSLPDIEEVKHKSVNKGHGAMRVFRMLPATQKSKGEAASNRQEASRVLLMFWVFFYELAMRSAASAAFFSLCFTSSDQSFFSLSLSSAAQ